MSNWNRWAVLCIAFAVLGAPHARAFDVQSGIGFLAITNALEHDEFVLEDVAQQEIGRGLADSYGSLVFRELEQGATYFLTQAGGETLPVTVRRFEDHPDDAFYDAQSPLVEGLNYIRMRDGTLLAAMVRPPLNESCPGGTGTVSRQIRSPRKEASESRTGSGRAEVNRSNLALSAAVAVLP